MLARTKTIVDALNYKGGLDAIVRARPRSLTSWLIANRLAQLGPSYRTIIDAGANVGQFARAASQCFPGAQIYSFEPLADIAERLRWNLRDLPTHHVFAIALGNTDGTTSINRNTYDQSSSILPLRQTGLLKGSPEVGEETVQIRRLDSVLAEHDLARPLLLKLDLQGYEVEALRGAGATLLVCDAVLVETVFVRQYEGEPLFGEVNAALEAAGFQLDRPINLVSSGLEGVVQMDALYRRR